jgi:ADP-ribose pyrophosphatase YjhB (NUDIX family)
MTGGDLLDHNEWFAQQPGVVLAAGALITDPAGRVLLVKPNYRDFWTVAGGICEHGEPPHAGCAREVAEEIGLELLVGRLLAIDWSQPYGPQARPIMHFLFDCGGLEDGAGIVLQREELDDFRFTDPAELSEYLAPYGVRRVTAALEARASGVAVYQPMRVS